METTLIPDTSNSNALTVFYPAGPPSFCHKVSTDLEEVTLFAPNEDGF
jgi:hypothetical protein